MAFIEEAGAFVRPLIFLLFLFFLAPAGKIRASAVAPADLLLVCNSGMKESCAVANHYARRRGVPLKHIVGLELPALESMPRGAYETRLARPLRQKIEAFRQERQRNPVLLLVYGVPLKIQADPADKARQVDPKLVAARVASLAGQVERSLGQLEQWTGAAPRAAGQQNAPPEELLRRGEEVIRQSLAFLKGTSREGDQALDLQKFQAVLLRLTGLAPTAESLAARAAMRRPEARQLLQAAPVLQLHGVLQAQLNSIPFRGVTAANVLDEAAAILMDKGLLGELQFWLSLQRQPEAVETGAAVDSELALLLAGSYNLAKWLPNPFQEKYDGLADIETLRRSTLMVARLDGPTPETAKRLVDDAVEVEQRGLTGTFYIDARGLAASGPYGDYDQHLRKLARILREQTSFPVVLDDRPELFPEKGCPDAALYCGWYSLTRYQDSFAWRQGAVGFHVASGEAATLRQPDSQVWCKRMLEEGVAATLGPVQEPYLQSFPLPDQFFPLLMSGRLPLVQVYYRTLPFLSWRQILIGDPLYNPFQKNPALK